jgi:hypothetical protein
LRVTENAAHPVDFLAELALGALPEAEAGPIREHIAGCPTCMAEYRQMVQVARLLPLAGEDVSVSPSVRESVMDRIEHEPRPITANPRRAWSWQPAALAAGIALLIAAGIGGGFAIGRSNGGTATNSPQQALVAALAQGTAQTDHFQSDGLTATFVHAPGAESGFISTDGLPQLPAGKAYQAWFSKDGKTMEPANTFTAPNGTWIDAPGPINQYVAMGLTIEDAGGAKAPTTAPFMLINLS